MRANEALAASPASPVEYTFRAPLQPAPDGHIESLRKLVRERGENEAFRAAGLTKGVALRVLSGLPVRAGTRALLREVFGSLT